MSYEQLMELEDQIGIVNRGFKDEIRRTILENRKIKQTVEDVK